MKRRLIQTTLALAIALACMILLLYGLSPRVVQIPAAYAQASCCEMDTSNEELPPGDWDAVYLRTAPGAFVTRTNTYVQEGSYSYQHNSDCGDSTCSAWTYITCTTEMTTGILDGYALWPLEPGHDGFQDHTFFSAGESTDPWVLWDAAWSIYYDFGEKRARFFCGACEPHQDWPLGVVITDTWHHYRVEWDLPFDSVVGSIQVWHDDYLFIDESGLTTEDTIGDWATINSAGAGVLSWHFVYDDDYDIYIDSVEISSCDPTPTPTPSPSGDCEQYGHAAVLNVDTDCSAVLRFRAIPNYVPFDATVQRATLHLWGAAAEVLGETIYVAPLVPLWGEMTCDWCRRTVGETWALPGATAIPHDRYPGSVASFETALGWIEVDIPPYLVEDWALSSASNPGLILSNENLTGKFGIASREWIDADYMPYMTIYYTE